jgi:hypothetical protein
MSGEAATISFATANADSVTISGGVGSPGTSGSVQVMPTQTTTYTLTANNARGPATCNLTVTVTEGQAPRIVAFGANPATITAGQTSTLTWNVENATSVEISGIGTVNPTGSREVTPGATQTYVLTARNATGSVESSATVTVNPGPGAAPTLTACVANPTTSPSPGSPVQISYVATNATSVEFNPAVPGATVSGPVTVMPQQTTAYTITAIGSGGRTATCSVNVNVTPPPAPEVVIVGGTFLETLNRELVLDATPSTDPSGGALTYRWEPLGTGASVLDPGQARTRVQLAGPFGDYVFRVTVTNAGGVSSTGTVTVRFRSITLY